MKASRRAFTRDELIALCVVVVILGALWIVLGQATRGRHGGARQLKDQTQIRGIHQGMVLFAQNNQDRYPVPSELDKAHTTLTSTSAKDDPGSVLSIMIYAGFISPELTASPAEQSGLVRIDDDYNLNMLPLATATTTESQTASGQAPSSQAQWDPAFRGSSAEQVASNGSKAVGTLPAYQNVTGNNSYAMMPFFGKRSERWSNTFNANEAVLGNRGPSYEVVGSGAAATYRLLKTGTSAPTQGLTGFTDTLGKGTSSVTLLIHGGRSSWEGNVAFNDNHVDFITKPDPEDVPFTFSGLSPATGSNPARAGKRRENFFLAEDDATLTPLPTQIGRVNIANTSATNPLKSINNWLKTWTVSGVADDATTSEVTFVVD